MNRKPTRCYGWPYGTPCDNQPGGHRSPYWCERHDKERIAALDKQFAALERQLANPEPRK